MDLLKNVGKKEQIFKGFYSINSSFCQILLLYRKSTCEPDVKNED